MGLGFLGGMAQGASRELTAANDRAFQMKLLNAQVEKQIQLSDYERAGDDVTSALGNAADVVLPAGMRANKADQAGLQALIAAKQSGVNAGLRGLGRGSNQGMTRAKFNELYQVKTAGDDNDWMNNTEVIATRDRLKREEPSVAETNLYNTSVKSKDLIKTLWDMRGKAVEEGGIGKAQGLISRADRFVTGGENRPKTTAFMNMRQSLSTKFAKMFEDTGNIAWQEAERAVRVLGDERLDSNAAQIQYDTLNSILDGIKDTTLKSSPGLRRKIQREQEGTNMQSLTDSRKEKGEGAAAPTGKNPYADLSLAQLASLMGKHQEEFQNAKDVNEKKKNQKAR